MISRTSPVPDPCFSLLFPAARAGLEPQHQRRLAAELAGFSAWTDLPAYAEQQRMAPLFYHHARASGLDLPEPVRLQFQGLFLRHQMASRARLRALTEILTACRQADLEVVLLKGAALFCLAYPRPALHPMRDLDLLARPAQARRLHALLLDLGYAPAPHAPGAPRSTRHLPDVRREVDGFQVSIEVHHSLFDPTWRAARPDVNAWIDRSRPFSLDGIPARTLALPDMLWHIYQHMINEEIRLISIADLISIAEQFVSEIDWPRLWRETPAVPRALGLFHALSPLSDALCSLGRIPTHSPAVDLSQDLQGWPRVSARQAREPGAGQLLRRTLLPPEGWLRLYYAAPPERPLAFYRWLAYPLELLRQALFRLIRTHDEP